MKPLFQICILLILASCTDENKQSKPPNSNQTQSSLDSYKNHPNKSFLSKWEVTKKILTGGKQQGVELIKLDNGRLEIVIIPSRGMGILEVKMDDIRLGWNSPVKEVVHPSFIDLDSRGGLGWLEGFNEWMVRCGLEFAGHPGTDQFIDNTGSPSTLNLTLHGKIQNTPASNYNIIIDSEPPHRIRIQGTVYESFFYGPKLKIITEISTVPGSEEFTISDKIINEGTFAQEFQLIYHGNYGSSILEKGAQIHAPSRNVTPMNEHASKNIEKWKSYLGPTPGFIEEVYLVEPLADENSSTLAFLLNSSQTVGTSVRWNITELPYLTIWKNTASEKDGYVTGIEPATSFPFNRRIERKYGRVPMIQPGETRSFTLDFGIHKDDQSIQDILDEIDQIQGEQIPLVNKEPPVTE